PAVAEARGDRRARAGDSPQRRHLLRERLRRVPGRARSLWPSLLRPHRSRGDPRRGVPLAHRSSGGMNMSTARLTLVHARYSLVETARTPIALIGTLVFPTLALLFFVVPQQAVAGNALYA